MFHEVLPVFKKHNKNKSIAFLHIDADLYSSTKTIFDQLGDMIVPGTIIIFDEYYGYPAFKEGEYRAFQEYINSRDDIDFQYIAYNPAHEQAVVKIIKNS